MRGMETSDFEKKIKIKIKVKTLVHTTLHLVSIKTTRGVQSVRVALMVCYGTLLKLHTAGIIVIITT